MIFTESRRTQAYLFDLLSEHGYKDELVLMNATNTDPLSTRIYRDWMERHKGTDSLSGSPTPPTAKPPSWRNSANEPPS